MTHLWISEDSASLIISLCYRTDVYPDHGLIPHTTDFKKVRTNDRVIVGGIKTSMILNERYVNRSSLLSALKEIESDPLVLEHTMVLASHISRI